MPGVPKTPLHAHGTLCGRGSVQGAAENGRFTLQPPLGVKGLLSSGPNRLTKPHAKAMSTGSTSELPNCVPGVLHTQLPPGLVAPYPPAPPHCCKNPLRTRKRAACSSQLRSRLHGMARIHTHQDDHVNVQPASPERGRKGGGRAASRHAGMRAGRASLPGVRLFLRRRILRPEERQRKGTGRLNMCLRVHRGPHILAGNAPPAAHTSQAAQAGMRSPHPPETVHSAMRAAAHTVFRPRSYAGPSSHSRTRESIRMQKAPASMLAGCGPQTACAAQRAQPCALMSWTTASPRTCARPGPWDALRCNGHAPHLTSWLSSLSSRDGGLGRGTYGLCCMWGCWNCCPPGPRPAPAVPPRCCCCDGSCTGGW